VKAVSTDLVSLALRNPATLPGWPLAHWDKVVRQARQANLLARIAAGLAERALLSDVPAAPRAHLRAAGILAQAHQEATRREVTYICQALASARVEIVLLKGAAYLLAGLAAANGRLFSDVDILVPKDALDEVEAQLMLHGWTSTHHKAHDQRYYRRWMHELPPMHHVERDTFVDVHHAILPQTARLKPDSAKLLAASVPVAEETRLRVLAPVDMILHSAAHLFHNEELSTGLRDLADLDSLLRQFGSAPGFWPELTHRAAELDLLPPLYYAMRYTSRILATPVPDEVLLQSAQGVPPRLLRGLMDSLWLRALRPDHPSAVDWLTPTARRLLFFRAHWLRMPPHLLIYHFTAKALRRKDKRGEE